MSFGKVLPTKINLISLRRNLRTIRTIRRLLENKREVLLLYLRASAKEYEKYYNIISEEMKKVYESSLSASVQEGLIRIKEITSSVNRELKVNISTRIAFGVKVPTISVYPETIAKPTFTLFETSPYLDETYIKMKELMPNLLKLIESEATLKSLIRELRRTQRLINSLDYFILPWYNQSIKFIRIVLEDRQREEFQRLKFIRKVLERRRASGI